MKKYEILVVDDDIEYLRDTEKFLNENGFVVTAISEAATAVEYLKNNKADILLADYLMKDMNGLDLAEKLRSTNKELVIILQTMFIEEKPKLEVLKNKNIQGYYNKSDSLETLLELVLSATKTVDLINEVKKISMINNFYASMISGVSGELMSKIMSLSGYNDAIEHIEDDECKKISESIKKTLIDIKKNVMSLNISIENDIKISELFERINILLKFYLKINRYTRIEVNIKCDEYIFLYEGIIPYLICNEISRRGEKNDEIFVNCKRYNNGLVISIEAAVKIDRKYNEIIDINENVYLEISENTSNIVYKDI